MPTSSPATLNQLQVNSSCACLCFTATRMWLLVFTATVSVYYAVYILRSLEFGRLSDKSNFLEKEVSENFKNW